MIGDNFMWFPDGAGSAIFGETTDTWFAARKAFEIFSFKFDLHNSDEEKAQNQKAGVEFGSFTVKKNVDSASVPLYRACSMGTPFPTIMLALRKAGGSNLVYLQYIFRKNFVTGIEWEGGEGDKTPRESLTFSFKAMGMQYVRQMPDGTGDVPDIWAWNIAQNRSSTELGAATLDFPGLDPAPKFLPPNTH